MNPFSLKRSLPLAVCCSRSGRAESAAADLERFLLEPGRVPLISVSLPPVQARA